MPKSDTKTATTNAFNKLLGRSEEDIKPVSEKNEKVVQNIQNLDRKIEISETYINIRFPKKEKQLLTDFLNKEKGLPLSSGIRQILFEYMKNNEIR